MSLWECEWPANRRYRGSNGSSTTASKSSSAFPLPVDTSAATNKARTMRTFKRIVLVHAGVIWFIMPVHRDLHISDISLSLRSNDNSKLVNCDQPHSMMDFHVVHFIL